LWWPTADAAFADDELVAQVTSTNREMSTGRDTVTVPPMFMLRILAAAARERAGEVGEGDRG